MRKAVCVIVVLMLIAPLSAKAQQRPSHPREIEVTGNGQVHAKPDEMILDLSIETHAPTAAKAAQDNAQLATKVVDALKAKLGTHGTVDTGTYNLYPEYEQHPGIPYNSKIIGYRAVNSIVVRSGELDLAGPLIDAALDAGANRVGSLHFALRNDAKARREAVMEAGSDAKAQAQALAQALGVKLKQVQRASISGGIRPLPVVRMLAAAAPAAASAPQTPVSPGTITVSASVSVTYEIQ